MTLNPRGQRQGRREPALVMRITCTLVVVCAAMTGVVTPASADQASQPGWAPAAGLDAGINHTCALLADGAVRC